MTKCCFLFHSCILFLLPDETCMNETLSHIHTSNIDLQPCLFRSFFFFSFFNFLSLCSRSRVKKPPPIYRLCHCAKCVNHNTEPCIQKLFSIHNANVCICNETFHFSFFFFSLLKKYNDIIQWDRCCCYLTNKDGNRKSSYFFFLLHRVHKQRNNN